MPRFGLLPLILAAGIFAVAAGSFSALAGPGPLDVSTGSDDDGDVQALDGEDDGATGNGEEKAATAIADEFGVTPEEVLAQHDEGIGFGALFKLYQLARANGMTFEEFLATIPTGADGEPEFGFGQLRKDLTEEEQAVLEEGPKNLGELVSAASKDDGGDEEATEAAQSRGRGHGKK